MWDKLKQAYYNMVQKAANSAPISAIAQKTYQPPKFNNGPTVVYNKPNVAKRNLAYGVGATYSPQNRMIRVNTPRGKSSQSIEHETAHDRYFQNPSRYKGFAEALKRQPNLNKHVMSRLDSPLYNGLKDPTIEAHAYTAPIVNQFRRNLPQSIHNQFYGNGQSLGYIDPEILKYYDWEN